MARAVDGRSVAAWRRRLGRYAKSGWTVASFCRREGVSVPTFYAWRKRIGTQEEGPAPSRRPTLASPFQAVTVLPAAPVVAVRLPGGVQLDICSTTPEVVRLVSAELVAADHPGQCGPLLPVPLQGRAAVALHQDVVVAVELRGVGGQEVVQRRTTSGRLIVGPPNGIPYRAACSLSTLDCRPDISRQCFCGIDA